jgi:hypothetical protein
MAGRFSDFGLKDVIMTFRIALLASVLLLPVVAKAQEVHGLYINVDTGLNVADSMPSSTDTTRTDTNLGPLVLIDPGWGFGGGLRAEIEGSYRSNDISGISTRRQNGTRQPPGNASGTAATYAVMVNAVYDFPIHPFGLPIKPYIGTGPGYGWLDFGSAGGNGYGIIALPQSNTY